MFDIKLKPPRLKISKQKTRPTRDGSNRGATLTHHTKSIQLNNTWPLFRHRQNNYLPMPWVSITVPSPVSPTNSWVRNVQVTAPRSILPLR